jgi:hypothetical protein
VATKDIRDTKDDRIDRIIVSDDLFLLEGNGGTWTLESTSSGGEVDIDPSERENLKKALDFITTL